MRKELKTKQKLKNIYHKIKYPSIYIFINFISILIFINWLMPKIVTFFEIKQSLLGNVYLSLFAGLFITLMVNTFRALNKHSYFYIDSSFLKWAIIHSIGYFLLCYILIDFNITNNYLFSIIAAFGIYMISKISQRIKFGRTNRFSFPRISSGVWVVIVIILLIASFNVYFTYDTKNLSGNYKCVEDKVYESTLWAGMEASTLCMEYQTSRCKFSCIDNKAFCKCQATAWNLAFPSRNIFGMFQ